MAKKFPDLNKDGKVTQADVLKGRGVFNEGGEADRYLQLYEQMQKSLVEAKNDEKKKEKIRRRFQQSIVGFDDSAIANAMKMLDAQRNAMAEGSLMMPVEREAYGKGKLIKEVSPKIIDLFERLVGPKTLAKKEKMVDEAQAQREIQRAVEKNPQILEQLSDEDYMETISLLPQKQQANFGMADAPLDDNMVDMLLDMDPEEVAKNLELFTSIDDMFEYAGSLDAKDARKFMNALSPEDKEIFAGELPEFELGPREVKGHGGFSGVSILLPAEYGEAPEDAYNNISSKEEKEEVKNMNSDNEMEEEYLDYVADEVLSQEEQDYLFKTLDKDNKLEKILDKIMLNATEFTGSGEVDGPGSGISDSIPARLSDGEFVFTRKATDQIGADKLQKMMDDAEREFDQRNGKAKGGMPVNNRYSTEDNENQQQEVENQMLSSNRMPSLMNR